MEVPVHSLLIIVQLPCYVLFDFTFDIQTLYTIVVLIILTLSSSNEDMLYTCNIFNTDDPREDEEFIAIMVESEERTDCGIDYAA